MSWCLGKPTILQPRTRKVQETHIADFIVKEDTPMEDIDPEIAVNPVLRAKMAMENEGKRKGRHGIASNAPGAPGAFSKLGIVIDPPKGKDDKSKPLGQSYLKDVDKMLTTPQPPGPPPTTKATSLTDVLKSKMGRYATVQQEGSLFPSVRP